MLKKHKLGASFLLASVLVVSFGIWWNSPERTIPVVSSNTTQVLGSETSTSPLDTSYMSTVFPGRLHIKSSNENAASAIVGQYLLTSKDLQLNDQVGITIGKLNNDTIDNISPVQLRLRHPETYQQSSLADAPEGAIVFISSNGYEKSVFWAHDGLYSGVVVSGTVGRIAELNEILTTVVFNWQWL